MARSIALLLVAIFAGKSVSFVLKEMDQREVYNSVHKVQWNQLRLEIIRRSPGMKSADDSGTVETHAQQYKNDMLFALIVVFR